uniref:Uncharacterized protein n=1 Tax=Physcomitrium patens TaxID=3218 RepID=A0A2K1IIX7_PHYPA|nr:hypothetical protein PHYPA_027920 [Physcomitrium patens]
MPDIYILPTGETAATRIRALPELNSACVKMGFNQLRERYYNDELAGIGCQSLNHPFKLCSLTPFGSVCHWTPSLSSPRSTQSWIAISENSYHLLLSFPRATR